MRNLGTLVATVAIATVSCLPVDAQRLVWLGTLQGGNASNANDIDQSGLIWGWSRYNSNSTDIQAVVWVPTSSGYQLVPIPFPNDGTFNNSEAPAARVINAWNRSNRNQTIRAYPINANYQPQTYTWQPFNSPGTFSLSPDGLVGSTGGCGFIYIPGSRSYTFCSHPNSPVVFTDISNYLVTNGSLIVGYDTVECGEFFRCKRGFIFIYGLSQPSVYLNTSDVPYTVKSNRHIVGTVEPAVAIGTGGGGFYYDYATRTRVALPNSAAARDITPDGSLIVGWRDQRVDDFFEPRAMLWERTSSGWVSRDLNQIYSSLLTGGSVLLTATGISSDGRYIVGQGYNAQTRRQEAYLLDIYQCSPHSGDVNDDCRVDDADLLAVLFQFGNTGPFVGRADTNCDGRVDDADLLTVLFNFGSEVGCEAVYIPDRDQLKGVWRYNIRQNTLTRFGGCTEQFYYGIAASPDGNIWTSRHTNPGFLDVLDANGNCIRQIQLPSGTFPRGLSVFSMSKRIVVAAAGQLHCYNNQNNTWSSINLPSGVGGATGVEFGPAMSYLYVTTSSGYLLKYNHNNGCPTNYVAIGQAPQSGYSADLAVLPDGRVLVAVGNRVELFDENCNHIRTLYTLGSGALIHGVAVDSQGTVWVTEYYSGQLYKSVGSSLQPVISIGGKVGEGLIVK